MNRRDLLKSGLALGAASTLGLSLNWQNGSFEQKAHDKVMLLFADASQEWKNEVIRECIQVRNEQHAKLQADIDAPSVADLVDEYDLPLKDHFVAKKQATDDYLLGQLDKYFAYCKKRVDLGLEKWS